MKKAAMFFVISTFVFISSAFAATPAEDMMSVMPDDVLGFMATSGGDAVKPAFEASTLGRLWNSPDVQKFYLAVKDQLLTKLEKESGTSEEDKKEIKAVVSFFETAVKCPIVVGAAVKASDQEVPLFGYLLLNAGSHKAELTDSLTKLEAIADAGDIIDVKVGNYTMHGPKMDDDVPIYWGWVDDYLVVAVNDDAGLAFANLSSSHSIDGYFNDVQAHGDAIAMFLDFQRIASLVSGIAERQGGADDMADVSKVLKELGLSEVRTLAARMGFSGDDLVCDELIEMPTPPTGLLAALKPVDMSMLKMVPADAAGAITFNVDVASIYDTIYNAISLVAGPEDVAEMDAGVAKLEEQMGFELRSGVLKGLSGQMVFYSIPPGLILEAPRGAAVLIAKTEDGKALETALSAAGTFAASVSDGMLQTSKQQKEEIDYHYWTAMPLAMVGVLPAWAVVDDYLVIATCPSLAEQATALVAGGANDNSLYDDPAFQKAVATMPDDMVVFKYADSKVQVKQILMTVQQFWPIMTMAISKEGLNLPAMIPTASKVVDSMEPSYEYTWFDADGLRYHYDGVGIEANMAAVTAGVPMGAAILMPALGKTRKMAKRIVSATNLKGIGTACMVYSLDYDDAFPSNLEVLIDECDVSPESLVNPQKPGNFDGPSYIIIPDQKTTNPPSNILAYENTEYSDFLDHGTGRINVLYVDGHVESVETGTFIQQLRKTYKNLGKEMPVIKFQDVDVSPTDQPNAIEISMPDNRCY